MNTTHAEIAKKLPPWLYKIAGQAYIDKSFPRHLFIETTANCNLQCEYCPRERVNNHMDFRLFKEIVDEASSHGPRSFSLHLFGEPMLYPKWAEAVEYIKAKNKRHIVLFTTNGTAINRNLGKLLRCPVDKVLWTYRPEARFTEETKGRLQAWKPFTVRLIKEVTPPEAYQEYSKWPNVELRSLHSYGGNIDLAKFGLSPVQSTKRYPCYHLFYAPAVAFNGEILICCADPKRKSVIGTFPQMSIAEAWQSQTMGRIRNEQLEGKYTGICENCDIWKQYPNVFFGHEFEQKKTF